MRLSLKSSRSARLTLILVVGTWVTLAANLAGAQIYKWADDNGIVNYSSQPPANRKAKALDTNAITLSVYESDKPRQDASARLAVASLGDKIDRLERQLEAERQARLYQAAADARAMQATYDECVAQRGVDCNGIYNGAYAYGPPVLLVPRVHRFRHVSIVRTRGFQMR
jgi:uncharacterized protein DUF4124